MQIDLFSVGPETKWRNEEGKIHLSLIASNFAQILHSPSAIFTTAGAVSTGKVEVEMDSVGEEVSLWQKMMQYPDSWAEGTLPLRSTMEKTKGKWGRHRPGPSNNPGTGMERSCGRQIWLWINCTLQGYLARCPSTEVYQHRAEWLQAETQLEARWIQMSQPSGFQT